MRSENDRYWATRHDTPLGEAAARDLDYDMFAFYQLDELPGDWVFDSEGLWMGWGNCERRADGCGRDTGAADQETPRD